MKTNVPGVSFKEALLGDKILLSEPFSVTPLVSPWYDNVNVALDTARYAYTWTNGQDFSEPADASRIQFQATDEISLTFDFTASSGFPYAQHLFYFKLATASQFEAPSSGFTLYLEPLANGEFYIDTRNSEDAFMQYNPTTSVDTYDAAVHTVHLYVKLNDLGSNNGIIKVFVDSILTIDISNLALRTQANQDFGQLLLGPYLNDGPSVGTNTTFVDNIVLYNYQIAFPLLPGNNLFVSTTGNDAVTRENNDINNPWLTIAHAAATAEVGDVVNFRSGVYSLSANFDPVSSVGNEGELANPIVFQSYPGETAEWQDGGFRFFINHSNWQFLNIDMTSTGRFLSVGDSGTADNLVFDGGVYKQQVEGGGANLAVIYVVVAGSGGRVRNIKFEGPNPAAADWNTNTAGVVLFSATKWHIHNCEVENLPWLAYWKHGPDLGDVGLDNDTKFYNNYVHDTSRGVGSNWQGLIIENNLFEGDAGAGLGLSGGDDINDQNKILHNTFAGGASFDIKPEITPMTACELKNNVFTAQTTIFEDDADTNWTIDTSHNLYPDAFSPVKSNFTDHADLAAWVTANGTDGVTSLEGSPTYINGTPTVGVITDYALAVGSLGKNAASDGSDMGADMSLVGIGNG